MQIVSYRFLARHFNVPSNFAKRHVCMQMWMAHKRQLFTSFCIFYAQDPAEVCRGAQGLSQHSLAPLWEIKGWQKVNEN